MTQINIMTPKEQAQKLLYEFSKLAENINWTNEETMKKAELLNDELGEDILFYWHELARKSALMSVDYILNSEPQKAYFLKGYWITPNTYWQEVKEELEIL